MGLFLVPALINRSQNSCKLLNLLVLILITALFYREVWWHQIVPGTGLHRGDQSCNCVRRLAARVNRRAALIGRRESDVIPF